MLTHRQIQVFHAVMAIGNFTDAAKSLSVTQSAVSKILAEAEREIGFPLFLRKKGGVVPSAEALALYKEVLRSFEGVERIARSAERIRNGEEGVLRIACVPALAMGFTQEVIAKFMVERPNISVSVEVYNSEEIADLVAGGHCDMGFSMLPLHRRSLVLHRRLSVNCVTVHPETHRFAQSEVLSLTDFDGESFISLARGTTTRQKIDVAFRDLDITRHLMIETRWSASVCNFVSKGFGVSIIEPFTAFGMKGIGFDVTPLDHPIEFSFASVVPAQIAPSNMVLEFAEFYMEYAEKSMSLHDVQCDQPVGPGT